MKKINYLMCVFGFTLLCLANIQPAGAQTTTPPHVYHVATWYMIPVQDSAARAERNALLKEYFDKVDMKNQYILHEYNMTHFFTDDSREFVTVYEYATWADIEKAGDRSDELEKLAWPDPQKRAEFFKKLSAYFSYHKDAIYSAMPSMMK